MKKNMLGLTLLTLLFPLHAYASGNAHGMTATMTQLVFQIGVIIFAAKLGGMLFEKLHLPSVLGELTAGIIIGPSLLGAFSFPGFAHGLFPVVSSGGLNVTPELYGIATIASILLLFFAGLETDLDLFFRYSIAGTAVGIGGVILSFFVGAGTIAWLLKISISDPLCLFMGVMSTATSVGITVRILSEKRKVDSPEGVTILAGAVIDDVLGIILLAVIISVSSLMRTGDGSAGVSWGTIAGIAGKALGVWLGFTVAGLVLARRISRFLKTFRSVQAFSILSLGLALLLAGLFEKAGLAMIIGAYIMGLTLSKTDIAYVIQETLHPLYSFFIPIFFTVMGMLVDIKLMLDPTVIMIGLLYTGGAIIAKMVGCTIPALFLNFNIRGALRIGLGMLPRGEVALIIAGIGLSSGILNGQMFGVAIMMTLITTLIAPPLLNATLNDRKGTRRDLATDKKIATPYNFDSSELTNLMESRLLIAFTGEGYFVHSMETATGHIFNIRKDKSFITILREQTTLTFKTHPVDVPLIKTSVYEAIMELHITVGKLRTVAQPESMRKDLTSTALPKQKNHKTQLVHALDPRCIIMDISADTKEGIITELVDALDAAGKLNNRSLTLEAILERERTMSTGMQDGVAIPHGKTTTVEKATVAVGFKREGIDFQAIDNKPCTIFIMVISPQHVMGPHIQFLAGISTLLIEPESREQLLACKNRNEVYQFFTV